jgi:lipopolysaccharide export system protein LptA
MKILSQLIIAVLLARHTLLACALTSDSQKPIDIEANSAELNDEKGIAIYRGNVIIHQGTLTITANQVTLSHQNKKVQKIIATGEQAHYQQQADGGQGIVNAFANTIEYMTDSAQVVLLGTAKLDQAGNTIEGEKITYDIAHKVGSAGSTQTRDSSGRVKMVFQPKKHAALPVTPSPLPTSSTIPP